MPSEPSLLGKCKSENEWYVRSKFAKELTEAQSWRDVTASHSHSATGITSELGVRVEYTAFMSRNVCIASDALDVTIRGFSEVLDTLPLPSTEPGSTANPRHLGEDSREGQRDHYLQFASRAADALFARNQSLIAVRASCLRVAAMESRSVASSSAAECLKTLPDEPSADSDQQNSSLLLDINIPGAVAVQRAADALVASLARDPRLSVIASHAFDAFNDPAACETAANGAVDAVLRGAMDALTRLASGPAHGGGGGRSHPQHEAPTVEDAAYVASLLATIWRRDTSVSVARLIADAARAAAAADPSASNGQGRAQMPRSGGNVPDGDAHAATTLGPWPSTRASREARRARRGLRTAVARRAVASWQWVECEAVRTVLDAVVAVRARTTPCESISDDIVSAAGAIGVGAVAAARDAVRARALGASGAPVHPIDVATFVLPSPAPAVSRWLPRHGCPPMPSVGEWARGASPTPHSSSSSSLTDGNSSVPDLDSSPRPIRAASPLSCGSAASPPSDAGSVPAGVLDGLDRADQAARPEVLAAVVAAVRAWAAAPAGAPIPPLAAAVGAHATAIVKSPAHWASHTRSTAAVVADVAACAASAREAIQRATDSALRAEIALELARASERSAQPACPPVSHASQAHAQALTGWRSWVGAVGAAADRRSADSEARRPTGLPAARGPALSTRCDIPLRVPPQLPPWAQAMFDVARHSSTGRRALLTSLIRPLMPVLAGACALVPLPSAARDPSQPAASAPRSADSVWSSYEAALRVAGFGPRAGARAIDPAHVIIRAVSAFPRHARLRPPDAAGRALARPLAQLFEALAPMPAAMTDVVRAVTAHMDAQPSPPRVSARVAADALARALRCESDRLRITQRTLHRLRSALADDVAALRAESAEASTVARTLAASAAGAASSLGVVRRLHAASVTSVRVHSAPQKTARSSESSQPFPHSPPSRWSSSSSASDRRRARRGRHPTDPSLERSPARPHRAMSPASVPRPNYARAPPAPASANAPMGVPQRRPARRSSRRSVDPWCHGESVARQPSPTHGDCGGVDCWVLGGDTPSPLVALTAAAAVAASSPARPPPFDRPVPPRRPTPTPTPATPAPQWCHRLHAEAPMRTTSPSWRGSPHHEWSRSLRVHSPLGESAAGGSIHVPLRPPAATQSADGSPRSRRSSLDGMRSATRQAGRSPPPSAAPCGDVRTSPLGPVPCAQHDANSAIWTTPPAGAIWRIFSQPVPRSVGDSGRCRGRQNDDDHARDVRSLGTMMWNGDRTRSSDDENVVSQPTTQLVREPSARGKAPLFAPDAALVRDACVVAPLLQTQRVSFSETFPLGAPCVPRRSAAHGPRWIRVSRDFERLELVSPAADAATAQPARGGRTFVLMRACAAVDRVIARGDRLASRVTLSLCDGRTLHFTFDSVAIASVWRDGLDKVARAGPRRKALAAATTSLLSGSSATS